VDPLLALATVEEALVSLTALANRHDGNCLAIIGASGREEVARALKLLPKLRWPPATARGAGAAAAGAAAAAGVTSAGVTLLPSDASKKAAMLQMILS
jgi:hypothetical protein